MKQNTTIVHYIEYLYPGIVVAETLASKCDGELRRTPEKVEMPAGALGFRFFYQFEIPVEGAAVRTVAKTQPMGMTDWYFYGEEMTIGELELLTKAFPNYGTALDNMRINKMKRCIRFKNGQMFFLHEGDVVLGRQA